MMRILVLAAVVVVAVIVIKRLSARR